MDIPHATQNDLEERLKEFDLVDDSLVITAINQAIKTHGNQPRYSNASTLLQHIWPIGISFINHEVSEGRIPTSIGVSGAISHDIPDDDPNMSVQAFIDLLGQDVYNIVSPLVDKNYIGNSSAKILFSKLRKLYEQNSKRESRIIFLADRYNNLRCMHTPPYLSEGDRQPTMHMEIALAEAEYLIQPFAKKHSNFYFKRISDTITKYKKMYPSLSPETTLMQSISQKSSLQT